MRTILHACASSVLMALLLASVSCEHRAPLTQGEVVGIADNLQRREGVAWGEPSEVLPPGDYDAQNRRWWQLRYQPGADGVPRIIVVDAESDWARLPPSGYVVRVPPTGKPGAANPVVVAEGHEVLTVVPLAVGDEARRTALSREVVRLNALAGDSGLMPLFSLKDAHDGRLGIIYGWQGDRGIARDDRVVTWLEARTSYRDASWVDLTQP